MSKQLRRRCSAHLPVFPLKLQHPTKGGEEGDANFVSLYFSNFTLRGKVEPENSAQLSLLSVTVVSVYRQVWILGGYFVIPGEILTNLAL